MIAFFRKHRYYSLISGLIQLAGLTAVIFADTRQTQMTIIVLMTFLFTGWALIHHHFHHALHPKVVVEYVLLSTLAITLTYFVLQ